MTQGSVEALAALHQRHRATLTAVVVRMGFSADADDVVQDVFLRLWQRPGRFDPDRASLRSFLILQARGRAIDLWRSEAARRAREVTDIADRTAPGRAADEDAMAHLHTERVLQLLDCLSGSERDAITLAFYGGHTYNEVADLLGEPPGTIKSRIRSGLKRLHQVLCDDPTLLDPAGG